LSARWNNTAATLALDDKSGSFVMAEEPSVADISRGPAARRWKYPHGNAGRGDVGQRSDADKPVGEVIR